MPFKRNTIVAIKSRLYVKTDLNEDGFLLNFLIQLTGAEAYLWSITDDVVDGAELGTKLHS